MRPSHVWNGRFSWTPVARLETSEGQRVEADIRLAEGIFPVDILEAHRAFDCLISDQRHDHVGFWCFRARRNFDGEAQITHALFPILVDQDRCTRAN